MNHSRMPDRIYNVGVLLILIGALSNLAFFVNYANEIGVFYFIICALLLAPWVAFGATLRLRPRNWRRVTLVTGVAGAFLVVSTLLLAATLSPGGDGFGGMPFLVVPFIGIVASGTLFALVWSAVRSERNRLAVDGDEITPAGTAP